jgi:hypothetical protein
MQHARPSGFSSDVLNSKHLTPKEESMQHARSNRLRRAVVYAALAALLGVVSLTLSQCTQVGDNLTGVGLISHKSTSCKERCDRTYSKLKQQENSLYRRNIDRCRHDAACIAAENARHAAVLAALEAQRSACKANCHHQGGGHGDAGNAG